MRAGLLAGVPALAGAVLGLLAASPAGAAVSIGAQQITVSGSGATALITRSPYRLTVLDAAGRSVLAEAANTSPAPLLVPPVPQSDLAGDEPARTPTSYTPLTFTVGTAATLAEPAAQFEGNLLGALQSGVQYSAGSVLDAAPRGAGVQLTLSTSDPAGRRLVVDVTPGQAGTLDVSARPSDATGIIEMGDSFASPSGEAFHGFGGRHNSLDEHGQDFFNYLQQENVGPGELQPFADATQGPAGQTLLFPNGPLAAYDVASSFLSNAGYGFLLRRDELSRWRLDSDRPEAWQVSTAGAGLDYTVAPGDLATAAGELTAITGRERVPPTWGVGPLLDRLVQYPSDSASHYYAEVEADIADIQRYHLPLGGYRIEGWHYLSADQLAHVIGQLHALGIHALVYFRAFVGQDNGGTDDPSEFATAVQNGYVATTAAGTPYLFPTNFQTLGAVIDFTLPAAVRWWQDRVRVALDAGADGFMLDFGEQVLPDMHFHDGETGATMHNRYPVIYQQVTRAALDAYEAAHPGRSLYFFARSGYSATPGTAATENATFPGDETTDFSRSSGLASQTTDMLNRAIGGQFGFGTDIGGYFDLGPYQATTKELFIRWAQWAALSPVFRLHGSVGAGTHTPWSYDQQTVELYDQLSALHLAATPLLLSLWREGDRSGIPPTRPLYLAYPNDPRAAAQDQEWLLGPDVLVAPVVTQGASSRTVYFPAGCWSDPQDGHTYQGPLSATVSAPLTKLPYFFACGTHPFSPPAVPTPSVCQAARYLRFAIPQRHGRVRRVVVYVNARRVKSVRAYRIRSVRIARPTAARFAVRIEAFTAGGRVVVSTRRFGGCPMTRAPRTRVRRRFRRTSHAGR